MSATVNEFLVAARDYIAANLIVDGEKIFEKTGFCAAAIDWQKLLLTSRVPTFVVSDNGGTLDRNNGVIDRRSCTVWVVDVLPRDAVGQEVYLRIQEIAEELKTLFPLGFNNFSLYLLNDPDVEPVQSYDGGVTFLTKAVTFSYEIIRDPAETDIWATPAKIILEPTSYAGGGIELGTALSAKPAGFIKQIELISKQDSGSFWRETRLLGMNVAVTFTVAECTTKLKDFIFGPLSTTLGGAKGGNSAKLGRLTADAGYNKFLLRPLKPARPYLYFPRALLTEFGALVWDSSTKHLQTCEITVVATYHAAQANAWYYGDPVVDTFPAL